jgi:hypothetical protein
MGWHDIEGTMDGCGSEVSLGVDNAIASQKRECFDSVFLCRIRVSLSLSRALCGCVALCVSCYRHPGQG